MHVKTRNGMFRGDVCLPSVEGEYRNMKTYKGAIIVPIIVG